MREQLHELPTTTPRGDSVPITSVVRARLAWITVGLFLAISLVIAWAGREQRSGWILADSPGDVSNTHLTLLSYCFLYSDQPLFSENAPLLNQITFFSGWRQAQLDGFALRPLPGLMAALLNSVFSPLHAALLVNWLSWALCAWATWRLSMALFHDSLAALVSVLFACGGMGMTVHIGDYSAHLPAFAGYYVGICLLFTSGVLVEQRSWTTHLLLGTVFAIVGLVFNFNDLLLVVIYGVTAWRRNRWYQVASTFVLALSAPMLWKATLGLMGLSDTGFEDMHLTVSLQQWWEKAQHPTSEMLGDLMVRASDFVLFDSPVVLALGFFSGLVLPRSHGLRWFGLLIVGLPLAASFATLTSHTRGYTVYQGSIWIYCWLGFFFAPLLRGRRWTRTAGVLGLAALLATHFAWSTAHLWGRIGPVKAYCFGWQYSLPYFTHAPAKVLSLTGKESSPILFGGDASLRAAGVYTTPRAVPIDGDSMSWGRAMGARAVPFFYLGLLGALIATRWRPRLIIVLVTVVFLVTSGGFAAMTVRTRLHYWDPYYSTKLPPGARFRYHVQLGHAFLDKLASALEATDDLSFFICLPEFIWKGRDDVPELKVFAGSTPIEVRMREVRMSEFHPRFTKAVNPEGAIAALRAAGEITVELANVTSDSISLAAWQRRGLRRRDLVITPDAVAESIGWPCLPALEIRLVRLDGSFKVVGF